MSGTVILEATIEADGHISATTITRSIPLLDAAAADAVRNWRFEARPGRRVVTDISVAFRICSTSAPAPAPSARTSISGMPADFAVVYEYGCQAGDKTGHLFVLSPPAFTATLTATTHDLDWVYRALLAADLLSRTEGLIVWEESVSAAPTVSNEGVSVTVVETQGFLCSDRANYPAYAVSVRSDGIWRRLWPTLRLDREPGDYENRLAPARTLIQRIVDEK